MSRGLDVLELFAEAQGLAPSRFRTQALADGFTRPQAGKSGLTRPVLTVADRKAKRAAISREQHARNMADPAKAERVRELRRERVRRFRARARAAT